MSNERVSLTPAQRLHFDIYGFVLLENVLNDDEIERMKGALYRMKADENLDAKRVYARGKSEHHVLFGNLVAYDPALLEYAAHPQLVPLVEEVVGGAVRLEETEAIINSRNPETELDELYKRRYNPTGFSSRDATRVGHIHGAEQVPLHLCKDARLPYRCRSRRWWDVRHTRKPPLNVGSQRDD